MRFQLSVLTLLLATTVTAQTSSGLYDVNNLRTFYFTFTMIDWYSQLQKARSADTNVRCTLTVDNVTYKDVGARFRGSSSYSAAGRKKSINVTMDAFVTGQSLMGYDSLNLSNGFNDPSFCREVVSYGILRKFMTAPQANYVRVYINNAYFGLYLNVQQPDGKFIKQWYKGNDGNRYRCDPPTGAGSGNSALQWLGTTLQNYKNAYELKNDPATAVKPWEDVRHLCDVLNNTANGSLKTELSKILDVDNAMWYLALNNVMVNLDSYVARGNDYYLYHDTQHDQITLLPWDMNESFGGFDNRMSIAQRLALNPYYNASNSSRPLIGKLVNVVPEWRAQYFHHVKQVVDTQFNWRVVGPLVAKYHALIDSSVRNDPNKLYTYQMFKDNVTKQMFVNSSFYRTEIPGLKQICDGREASLKAHADYKAIRASISNVVVPRDPKPDTTATITARIVNAATMGAVTLHYRDVGTWLSTTMFDDGNHGDGAANDGTFGGIIPAAVQQAGHRIHYYIGARTATTSGGAMNFHPATAAFRPPSYVVGFKTGQSPIHINELTAINANGVQDEKKETEDWLELYNTSTNPVDVGGMFLTDDAKNLTKWKIPVGFSIPGNGALLIWCDDEPADGPLHATFKLSGSGETVRLVDTDGKTLLSTIEFGAQTVDISNGWLLDGKPTLLVAYKKSTPAAPNSRPCSSRGYWPVAHAAHRIDLTFTGTPKIANTGTAVRVASGPKSGLVSLFIGTAPGILNVGSGVHLLLGGPMTGPFGLPTDAQGTANLPVTIPNDASLKGVSVFFQVAGTDSQGFTASNGVEVRICN